MARILLVGLGGIGCPAALALARSGFRGSLRLVDDDSVDVLNLHRQILFEEADVGRAKGEVAAARLPRDGLQVESLHQRFLPETADRLLEDVDVILEGTDNFATKFLAADACRLAGLPLVTAAAVEWRGTVFVGAGAGSACYRCLFEDIPLQGAPNCADVGVMGPLVGLVGILAADAALRLLAGQSQGGEILSVAADGAIRRRQLQPRRDCALCGEAPRVRRLQRSLYERGLASLETP